MFSRFFEAFLINDSKEVNQKLKKPLSIFDHIISPLLFHVFPHCSSIAIIIDNYATSFSSIMIKKQKVGQILRNIKKKVEIRKKFQNLKNCLDLQIFSLFLNYFRQNLKNLLLKFLAKIVLINQLFFQKNCSSLETWNYSKFFWKNFQFPQKQTS